jgi:hypothetical protein
MMGFGHPMKRKSHSRRTKSGCGTLAAVAIAALFVVLLLLRMIVFVVGRGHRHFQ